MKAKQPRKSHDHITGHNAFLHLQNIDYSFGFSWQYRPRNKGGYLKK